MKSEIHPDYYQISEAERQKLKELNKTHKQIYKELLNLNIQVNLHYIPVYRQPYYEEMGFKTGYCSEAEQYRS